MKVLDSSYMTGKRIRVRGLGCRCLYALSGVHGGCAKENVASARVMEKGGMVQYGTEDNGDPLFRFTAKE